MNPTIRKELTMKFKQIIPVKQYNFEVMRKDGFSWCDDICLLFRKRNGELRDRGYVGISEHGANFAYTKKELIGKES
jgi:hypothetical protein